MPVKRRVVTMTPSLSNIWYMGKLPPIYMTARRTINELPCHTYHSSKVGPHYLGHSLYTYLCFDASQRFSMQLATV